LGVSLMHDCGPFWLEGLSIAKIPLPHNPFARRIGLLWSRASTRLRMVHTFCEEAATVFARGNAATPGVKHRYSSRRR
jgi:hypothetical protein